MFKKIAHLSKNALTWLSISCMIALFILSLPNAWAQNIPRLTTESPYFYIPGGQPGVDQLPLKNTDVNIQIAGVIADVTIVQTYHNEGTRPIEAKYIFPGSTRAAVYAMNVRIGERLIVATVQEKQQARIEYETARSQGRTAALLEEHLPNVFQMNVANIMPGDEVRVELRYTELLVPQEGNYQFAFPTVVGPRYNSPTAQTQSSRDVATATSIPYHHAGEPNTATFNIQATIDSPIGIRNIESPSHALRVTASEDQKRAVIDVEKGFHISNRDFILNYRLTGDTIESGIMLYQGANSANNHHNDDGTDENFFLAMIEPPERITPEIIPPRDYIFVVDTSGSMNGFPLNTAKTVVTELMHGLRPNDTFNIMLFSGSSSMLSPNSVPATQANLAQAMQMLDRTYYGSGNTELIPALRRVFNLPNTPGLSRTVIVITDGLVTVDRQAFDLIRNNLNKANVFAFGIGSSVNRHLIEGMARAGMGEPFIATNAQEAAQHAQRFHRMIASPVLTDVRVTFEGFDAYDVEPTVLPDVLGERPIIIFGKWHGQASGNIIIEGHNANGPYRQIIPVTNTTRTNTTALRYLWARDRIATLLDKETLTGSHMYQNQITSLGLQYNLLTPYTSFIAVDHIVRNTTPNQAATVNQPSPMPENVSNLSIGAQVPSSPEPAAWGAMILVSSMLIMLARHQRRRKDKLTS